MIRFEEEFEVTMQITEQEFSAYLLTIVDTELDEMSTAFVNPKKPFRGHIKFNRFKLIPTQTFFKKASGQIEGEFRYDKGELLVSGSVTSNKLLLSLIIGFTLLCLVMLTKLLISSSNERLAVLAVGIFFLIGASNLIGIYRSIKTQKSGFLNRLKLLE